jgi:hypothetical protein
MAKRKKRSTMVFMKFLKDNQKSLKHIDSSGGEKYTRDPWMMKNCPLVDEFEEIMRKEETSF